MKDLLTYKDFIASIHFSAENEVFYGKIAGINDLVTFEGQSVKALKKAFREAVEDYLETCTAIGKDPEKTYKGTFNVRLPQQLHRRAAYAAILRHQTLNEFVKNAIAQSLESNNC
jgi:predicted HicB family RNase H-like nuclease